MMVDMENPNRVTIAMKLKKILTALLIAASVNGCATAMNEQEQALKWVETADGRSDAQAALQKNDFRLMAIAQRSTVIPGVKASLARQYELHCGVKFLPGAGDAINSKEQLRLMEKAYEYAGQYNEIIKQRCIP